MKDIVTLLTDFGLSDPYVSAMKGVILSINPKAIIIDISHQVRPQDINQAAYLLDSTWHYFPAGTIHVIVVDPQVGSQRRIVMVEHKSSCFIAPDNGVLSYLFPTGARTKILPRSRSTVPHKLSPGTKAVTLTNPRFWRPSVSATFHGRDIMAPAAAHLSLGAKFEEFGDPIQEIIVLPLPNPNHLKDRLTGHIIYIDNFGNLISDIHSADLIPGNLSIEVCGQKIGGLSQYYTQKEGLVALINSSDRLEIAKSNGSAAAFTGASLGDEITIRPLSTK